jgi:hypothetical protein
LQIACHWCFAPLGIGEYERADVDAPSSLRGRDHAEIARVS